MIELLKMVKMKMLKNECTILSIFYSDNGFADEIFRNKIMSYLARHMWKEIFNR